MKNDSVFKEATRRLASILCNIMENSIGWSSQGKGAVGFYFLLYSRTTVCVVACSKERKKTQVVPGSSMSVDQWYEFILCEILRSSLQRRKSWNLKVWIILAETISQKSQLRIAERNQLWYSISKSFTTHVDVWVGSSALSSA